MWYPYSKSMTPFERCKARWAMYARLGQGHAPGAVRGPPYNGRGTRSASRGGTAAVSGPHSISEGQVQLSQGGGHGQVGFHLGKALAHPFPLLPERASARAAAWAVEYHGHTRRLATRPMTPPPPPPPGITPLKGPAVENPRCFELRPGLSTPLPDILALRFKTESE
ncbi:hypothetical protein CCUS01_15592 [Colletotrichum cuscutae]|uniref:Uncharacterized protein n=1 Tax=Colletotrichum cuscutae TaxID=1209917 RepID=A0AAI9VGT5_9PEZI|nr:hypothetical protein CCUS01_15592 [Colletotrichum cuscutae]